LSPFLKTLSLIFLLKPWWTDAAQNFTVVRGFSLVNLVRCGCAITWNGGVLRVMWELALREVH